MTTGPRISIIVAVFNAASTLERCIDSIAGQTHSQRELIIMDGGSTDGSVDVLRQRSADITYWESQPDKGIYHAWNKGIARATGDWIAFVGADDYLWASDVLEKLAPRLTEVGPSEGRRGIRVVYGTVAIVAKNGDVLRHFGGPWKDARAGFGQTLTIPHSGTMHHRSLFAEHGVFDEQFRIVGDYDLLLRELRESEARFVPDLITVGFQHGGISNRPKAVATMLDELARVREKHGLRLPAGRRYSRVLLKMTLSAWMGRLLGDRASRLVIDRYRRMRGKPTIWQ